MPKPHKKTTRNDALSADAAALRRALADAGIDLGHAKAMDVMARLSGARNRHALLATPPAPQSPAAQAPRDLDGFIRAEIAELTEGSEPASGLSIGESTVREAFNTLNDRIAIRMRAIWQEMRDAIRERIAAEKAQRLAAGMETLYPALFEALRAKALDLGMANPLIGFFQHEDQRDTAVDFMDHDGSNRSVTVQFEEFRHPTTSFRQLRDMATMILDDYEDRTMWIDDEECELSSSDNRVDLWLPPAVETASLVR